MLCRLCFAIIVLCLASPRVVTHTRSHVDGLYTGAHARDQRPGPRSRVGARIERLKLIRVYDRRIKPSIYRVSREDRQLMCRSRALRSAIVAFAESISVFIPCEIADDRATTTTTTTTMTLCPFAGEYEATLPRESARNRARLRANRS